MGFFGRTWAGASRRANCHHPPRAQEGSPASAGLQALEDASAAPRSIAGSRLQDDTEDDCWAGDQTEGYCAPEASGPDDPTQLGRWDPCTHGTTPLDLVGKPHDRLLAVSAGIPDQKSPRGCCPGIQPGRPLPAAAGQEATLVAGAGRWPQDLRHL